MGIGRGNRSTLKNRSSANQSTPNPAWPTWDQTRAVKYTYYELFIITYYICIQFSTHAGQLTHLSHGIMFAVRLTETMVKYEVAEGGRHRCEVE
jgi:hypothetical protein